ncbi:Alcohol dehydrogenase [NADP(+)] [Folsomia candida]|uniref:Alcohol dehydrogenase [NADP(+)] n=1 Tax=Folsomia candida TaxID=158441 RepID=A0A226EV41_FOLCA|nr:Alcohol dehydrogenase [NADP(+)] [Folsomia candida]
MKFRLGTWDLVGEELEAVLNTALTIGYRHIDTAFMHCNEQSIGRVIRDWLESKRVKRKELFITSKLPPTGMHPEKVKHFCQLSLQNLGLSYLDMYLIQLPVGIKYSNDDELFTTSPDGTIATDCGTDIARVWKEMEKLVEEGLIKNIGISNFNEEQLEHLLHVAVIKPANLQIEVHAYFQQRDIRRFCKENGITTTAFCPLGSPNRDKILFSKGNCKVGNLLTDPMVVCLAEKCEKSSAQILLRHAIQKGITVIPKASSKERLQENLDIFNFYLIPSEMKQLDSLDKGQFERTFDYSFLGESFRTHHEFPFSPKIDESLNPHH